MSALDDFDAIDKVRCDSMLRVLVDHGASDALVTDLYGPIALANSQTRSLIASLIAPSTPNRQMPPPIPAGYREVYTDLFTAIDAERWMVYGASGVGNTTWGQGQGRTGFYSPDAVKATPEGLVFTTIPDPQGRLAQNGQRGWQTGFLASKVSFPLIARFEVRARFDVAAGFWPAPDWGTVASVAGAPGGSSVAERDTVEYFPNDPGLARQATHLLANGATSPTYNVVQSILKRSQRLPLTDPDGWHTYTSEVRRDGAHLRFTYWVDGVLNNDFSTRELAARGLPHDAWIPNAVGWNERICTQTGGAGGVWAPSAGEGPFRMEVAWFRVLAPIT